MVLVNIYIKLKRFFLTQIIYEFKNCLMIGKSIAIFVLKDRPTPFCSFQYVKS